MQSPAGTGTAAGDFTEVEGVGRVFGSLLDRNPYRATFTEGPSRRTLVTVEMLCALRGVQQITISSLIDGLMKFN